MRREEPQTTYKGGLLCSHETLFRKIGVERFGHSLPTPELEGTISKLFMSQKRIRGGSEPHVKNQNKHMNPNTWKGGKLYHFRVKRLA